MGALDDGHFGGELDGAAGLGLPDLESESARTIEEAVRVLLEGLGEDPRREGLEKTPQRVARALREGTRGYTQNVKDIVQGALFPEAGLDNGMGYAGGAGGLVVVRDINLFSFCESCLLPFSVKCHVGYIPTRKRVLGLSKLSRVADVFAKRLQDPQRLVNEVCAALHQSIKPAGVAVALQCSHIGLPEQLKCSSKPRHQFELELEGWTNASVCSRTGVFWDDANSFWEDFLALLLLRGINMDVGLERHAPTLSWCPLRSVEVPLSNGHNTRNLLNGGVSSGPDATPSSMITAVASILQSLGEEPSKKELMGTPYRFVQWMMNFKKPNFEFKLKSSDLCSIGNCPKKDGESVHEFNLPFCTQCEHHLLPFHGVVHISYLSSNDGEAVGRSTLQSLVNSYSSRLQVQERFTKQIAEAVYSVFSVGVMVVVEANHICMISRGIEKVGTSTATIAVMGRFSSDPAAKAMFLRAIPKRSAPVE